MKRFMCCASRPLCFTVLAHPLGARLGAALPLLPSGDFVRVVDHLFVTHLRDHPRVDVQSQGDSRCPSVTTSRLGDLVLGLRRDSGSNRIGRPPMTRSVGWPLIPLAL